MSVKVEVDDGSGRSKEKKNQRKLKRIWIETEKN